MAEESPSTQSYTYHCLCSTLILTTTHEVQSLPHRQEPVQDAALILPPPVEVTRSETIEAQTTQSFSSILLNVATERRPIIIRRDDGFEKRTLLRCTRCKIVIGYSLDDIHWENSERELRPVYLLPGGLLSTAEMVEGKQPGTPAWADQK
ncbi:hypothetical protein H2200_006115 [Cladophialophora chaetospira]|uniref:STEEP1 domain-containing protein n=1 Tax=Cladophialophora chaetospira TaxID=386627 RepID=A0AA38XAB3_9EURO|nr:hypothetical protein H2200_006115 [Cladophialophora chaetospira]